MLTAYYQNDDNELRGWFLWFHKNNLIKNIFRTFNVTQL
jgi:hypothetical protein